MATNPSIARPRHAVVLAAILGLHGGALLVVAAALRGLPVALPDWSEPIVALLPAPVKPEAPTPPERVGAADRAPEFIEMPKLDIPVFERTFQAPEQPSDDADGPPGDGPRLPVPDEQAPRLRMHDARLQAVIDACYPASARRRAQEGRGVVRVVVDSGGRAAGWRLEESTGFAALDAAIACVARRLEFEPARRDGRPVEAAVRIPVVFRLN